MKITCIKISSAFLLLQLFVFKCSCSITMDLKEEFTTASVQPPLILLPDCQTSTAEGSPKIPKWEQKLRKASSLQLIKLREKYIRKLEDPGRSARSHRRTKKRLQLVESFLQLKSSGGREPCVGVEASIEEGEAQLKSGKIGWKNLKKANEDQLNALQTECVQRLKLLAHDLKAQKKWRKRFQIVQGRLIGLGRLAPYHLRNIWTNTRSPTLLDLHGVASAAKAEKKVLEFIRAAKSAMKKSVIVITGKGNHLNRSGQRGTLFKAFPLWMEACKIIKGFRPLPNMGGYKVFVKPSLKFIKVNRYRSQKHEEDKSFREVVTHPEPAVEGDLEVHQLRRESVRLAYQERRKDYQHFLRERLQEIEIGLADYVVDSFFDGDLKDRDLQEQETWFVDEVS